MAERRFLVMHTDDNLATALVDLPTAKTCHFGGTTVHLIQPVRAKHKFALQNLEKGDLLRMYGVVVGRALRPIRCGELLTTVNIEHAVDDYSLQRKVRPWEPPDTSRFAGAEFMGYVRPDGRAGTSNLWLVIPLVFCENRNIDILRRSMEQALGYGMQEQTFDMSTLIASFRAGKTPGEIVRTPLSFGVSGHAQSRVFTHIDGLKFLTHDGGCGSVPDDIRALCRLLAAYIAHPNVGGATVLSLGCQQAQISLLKDYLKPMLGADDKPVVYCEQQQSTGERAFIEDAIKLTFAGMIEANSARRQPVPVSKLVIGLECGGSDGFSGISANPALGYCSDLLVGLGGSAILGEFPELNGVEQELINRCANDMLAERFARLMHRYNRRAKEAGSGFRDNPSPGNRAEGLITDGIKSAGAARKGGTSPIAGVLDYGERVTRGGLQLLCTPGSDVESTTGLAAAGANVILFTTGLGTPTGNPVAPTIKVSTHTALAQRMPDIIDIDAGTIITGKETIEEKGEELLNYIIEVASGRLVPHAVRLHQDDFIPWKRGISL